MAVRWNFPGTILAWIDGDTVDVSIDLGFKVHLKERLRLLGVNTPETNSRDADERQRAKDARDFAARLAPPGSQVYLVTTPNSTGQEKYGRWLAVIQTPDGQNVGQLLIANGHGVPYDGGKR